VNEPKKITKRSLWGPAAFCAALSLMKMFTPDGAADPAFYSFLPVCFFLVAFNQLELTKRISSLELRVREGSVEPRDE